MRLALLVLIAFVACDPEGGATPCQQFRAEYCHQGFECDAFIPNTDMSDCIVSLEESRELWHCGAEADELDWTECLETVRAFTCDTPRRDVLRLMDAACFFEIQGLPAPE